MEEKLKELVPNTSAVLEAINNWETVICGVSTAKRNGKVTYKEIRVRLSNVEEDIKSYCDSINQKLTNSIVGDVKMLSRENKTKFNDIYLVEYLSTGATGNSKFFEPIEEDGKVIYREIK